MFLIFKYLFYLQLFNTQGIHSKLEGQKPQLIKFEHNRTVQRLEKDELI